MAVLLFIQQSQPSGMTAIKLPGTEILRDCGPRSDKGDGANARFGDDTPWCTRGKGKDMLVRSKPVFVAVLVAPDQ